MLPGDWRFVYEGLDMTIRAEEFCSSLMTGSSRPIVVRGNTGDGYSIRLRAGGAGVRGTTTEWMADQLGSVLDLPMPEPCQIEISGRVAAQIEDTEFRQAVERSLGINLKRTGYGLGWNIGCYDGDVFIHHFGGFKRVDAE